MGFRLRIAGAQLPVTREVGANVAAIERGIAFAVAEKADVLLTPEGSLSGYTHGFDPPEVAAALEHVTAKAREAGLALALGTCFVEPDGRCCNQIRFYERDGTYLGFHSKILRCGSLEEPPTGEINHYAATALRTFQLSGTTVGGLICNDLWASPGCTPMDDTHLTQKLAGMGARVILHAVNGGRTRGEFSETVWRYHESNLQLRAPAGKLWIVTVDSSFPTDTHCSAPSGVVDPEGNWVCRAAPQGEQFFAYTICEEDVSR